jgi:hypothetical protein
MRQLQNTVRMSCADYMGHPFKKSLFDNDDSALQAPFVRTDVLSSQYSSGGW